MRSVRDHAEIHMLTLLEINSSSLDQETLVVNPAGELKQAARQARGQGQRERSVAVAAAVKVHKHPMPREMAARPRLLQHS